MISALVRRPEWSAAYAHGATDATEGQETSMTRQARVLSKLKTC